MKAKNHLTTTALWESGSRGLGAAKLVQEQKRLRNREEIVQVVRIFASRGPIATVYVTLYESSDSRTVGGLS